ncbi:MAG: asparagine synthase C-terminal domain-containing protein [Pseudomonadota bacterium]
MIEGLGDFVVVDFETPPIAWADTANSLFWPKLGTLDITPSALDISPTLKAAYSGAVDCVKSADGWRIKLEQAFGDVDSTSVIEGDSAGYRGKFALVDIDPDRGAMAAYTDPMRQIALFVLDTANAVGIATDIRLLAGLPGWDLAVSAEAIYHHLNFTYIPTPFTIYDAIKKVPAGSKLTIDGGGARIDRYWQPRYPEDLGWDEEKLAGDLRKSLRSVIGSYTTGDSDPACYLSGGTDSSTIAGILAESAGPERTHAFSIGFVERAFDELDFAETAAKAFGIDHHQRRIGIEECLAAIDILVDAFDEPFGNASAVPSYYCADLARQQGHASLLGGDGGDEIFGGNERYAKDYLFQRYFGLPKPIKSVGSMIKTLLKPVDQRLANKIKNFINRGSLANPERFYTDDSFASDFYEDLLTPTFRTSCPRGSSLSILKHYFADVDARSELNRLMYIDLQMAISDNDITKVARTAKSAGVSVLFPYLTPDLIDLMGRIPAGLKVHRTEKRHLFKKAVAPIIPQAIIAKKKQGFGLPFGHWFRHDPKVGGFLRDVLLAQRSVERGFINKAFLERILDRHQQGVWDYSNELWLLLMLELWHQRHVDANEIRCHAA